ncbi:Glutamine-dependent NAD(+) synthetase [Desulfonema limicola]|uniref:Glutamine-dependent NAD(+) synthetase n=1 Tax=Desulfonema limicola TaxID=45656 RepID=A0A975B3D6_9BACT|nr:NAD(+) synthase [Desulfonema limicola]QTA78048.1 Glutamine-dependent NAD(+) synthetase [Desulfonema limicola]
MTRPFNSIYSHGFIRAAVCIPVLRVADPGFNLEQTIRLAKKASDINAGLALFPEMGISAYSNEDLFHQDALLEACEDAVIKLIEASQNLTPVILAGSPMQVEGKLFNCALIIYQGRLLGIVPKTFIPNYREFYEKRQFTSANDAITDYVNFLGQKIPFGNNLVFDAVNVKNFSIAAEICEDLWTPIPPSTYCALAGATIIANLSASNITIGKAEYRRNLCASHSGKCISAYLYSAAGPGESTTDLAWDGYALIYESSELLAKSERFIDKPQIIAADIDIEKLAQERMRTTSFNDSAGIIKDKLRSMRHIGFEFQIPSAKISLMRNVERFPFVPENPLKRDERCFEAYNIQIHGLMKRLSSSGINKIVIGVSGGLDSTQALIVAAKTMDRLGLSRKNILGYTLPGFATSKTTHKNAVLLMESLGIKSQEIDIRPLALQMMKDIGHPFAENNPVYDITFENIQAGERTSILFRLANFHKAMVLGTGDLSEIALGWSTYGVGDHMSHYNVNASVPKTMIQHLIRWVINTDQFAPETGIILRSILDTEISPELIPPKQGETEQPAQSTEAVIGPYELQDFNLYYITRFGFRPGKVAFLSHHAWHDRTKGKWSDLLAPEKRNQYNIKDIKKWLHVFLYRFFKISQFKRSAAPNSPKVGSGGSLSPRGDWRAPSDSEAVVWIDELQKNVPDEI